MGLPYVLSSDLVSAYPAKSLEIAQYVDGLIPLLAMTQNAQTGTTYSFVLTDFTKLVTLSNASAVAVTLPLEATVAWPAGTQLRLLNQGAGTVTVAGAVGVTINGSPLTLTQYKGANLIKTGTNTWTFIPFASGVGAADFSNTATGTYSGFKYLTFTTSSTITISTAGFADLVIVGGGGRGGSGGTAGAGGGGGAGGFANLSQVYLPAGTLTVTVGGATAPSRIGSYVSPQGGGGGDGVVAAARTGDWGGSGGGAGGGGAAAGGTALVSFGFDGGTTSGGTGGASGGGGAGAVGVNSASSLNGGAGGAGSSTTIAGTTPTGAYVAGAFNFGGGGGGGAYGAGTAGAAGATGGAAGSASGNGSAAAANLGGGGGGAYGTATNYAGGLGGSGFIIVRVAV